MEWRGSGGDEMNNSEAGKGGEEHQRIIPLSKIVNSIGSSIFEGNDRDLVWDREISDEGSKGCSDITKDGNDMPKELHFISLKEREK